MWRRPFLLFFLSACIVTTASAMTRPFPENVQRGKMTPADYPMIVIEGKTRHLAPGARIWNQDNLIEMPAALRGSNLIVNYTENDQGDIDRVWILTAEEAATPIKSQKLSQPH